MYGEDVVGVVSDEAAELMGDEAHDLGGEGGFPVELERVRVARVGGGGGHGRIHSHGGGRIEREGERWMWPPILSLAGAGHGRWVRRHHFHGSTTAMVGAHEHC